MKLNSIFIIVLFLTLSTLSAQNKKLKPSDYDAVYPQFFNAIKAASKGEFEEAITDFELMLQTYPKHQDAFIYLTVCDDAINRKISVNAAEYFFEGVNARFNLAGVNQVMYYLNQAFEEEDSYLPFYLWRGSYFAALENYENALSDFSVAIQLAPKQAVTYYNRGKLYSKHQYYDAAMQDFNKTIVLNPDYASAYVRRAYIFHRQGDFNNVILDFQKANVLDSTAIKSLENSSLLNNIATVYMEKNDFSEALNILDLAIKADDRWYEPYLNRGIVYKSLGNFDKALTDLNKAIELKPGIGKSYYNRGLIFKEKNEFKKAKEDFIRSLTFKDTEPRVYFTLAEVYKELKEYNLSTEFYEKAIEAEPQHIWAYYQLASLYDQRRGFEQAVKYYDKFIKRSNNDYFDHKIKAHDRMERIKKYLEKRKKK